MKTQWVKPEEFYHRALELVLSAALLARSATREEDHRRALEALEGAWARFDYHAEALLAGSLGICPGAESALVRSRRYGQWLLEHKPQEDDIPAALAFTAKARAELQELEKACSAAA